MKKGHAVNESVLFERVIKARRKRELRKKNPRNFIPAKVATEVMKLSMWQRFIAWLKSVFN